MNDIIHGAHLEDWIDDIVENTLNALNATGGFLLLRAQTPSQAIVSAIK